MASKGRVWIILRYLTQTGRVPVLINAPPLSERETRRFLGEQTFKHVSPAAQKEFDARVKGKSVVLVRSQCMSAVAARSPHLPRPRSTTRACDFQLAPVCCDTPSGLKKVSARCEDCARRRNDGHLGSRGVAACSAEAGLKRAERVRRHKARRVPPMRVIGPQWLATLSAPRG